MRPLGPLYCKAKAKSLLQDAQLVPFNELSGSESEGDEDMFVDDAAAAGAAFAASRHVLHQP
jgi:hypothetical protein